jgi:hypothetical protein
MTTDNIEYIVKEIKEKIKKNPKYLNPCNKEFQDDVKRFGFLSGNRYVCFLQQNGIMNRRKYRINSERKCCHPKCLHPYETYVDPVTGVAAWYKVKTVVNGEKFWDGESFYCNEHEHKMRKQIRKGTLKSDSNAIKGRRVERAFEKIGYRDCNKEKDNYNFYYDLYDPIRRLRIQVRSIKATIHIKKWIKIDGTEEIYRVGRWH